MDLTQYLSFHPVQIIQNGFDIGKLKILRQFPNAVIKLNFPSRREV